MLLKNDGAWLLTFRNGTELRIKDELSPRVLIEFLAGMISEAQLLQLFTLTKLEKINEWQLETLRKLRREEEARAARLERDRQLLRPALDLIRQMKGPAGKVASSKLEQAAELINKVLDFSADPAAALTQPAETTKV